MSAPESKAVTPGQAAYVAAASWEHESFEGSPYLLAAWERLSDRDRKCWDDVAAAAIAARQPQPATWEAWEAADRQGRTMAQDFEESKLDAMRRAYLAGTEARQPQPAPGVTEAQLTAALEGFNVDINDHGFTAAGVVDNPAVAARGLLARLGSADPQPAPGLRMSVRTALLEYLRELADCQSIAADGCPKCNRHADEVLAIVTREQPAPGVTVSPEGFYAWPTPAPAQPAPGLAAAIQGIIDRYPEREPAPGEVESQAAQADCTRHMLAKVTRERDLLFASMPPGEAKAVMSGRERRDVVPGDEPAPVTMTPAVVRPLFGSVLVLAVHPDQDDETARKGEEAIRAATEGEGVTVVTVRGVEALRTWEPPAGPEPAPRWTERLGPVVLCEHSPAELGVTVSSEPQPAPDLGAAYADLESEVRDVCAETRKCRADDEPCRFCERLVTRVLRAVDAYARDVAGHERTRPADGLAAAVMGTPLYAGLAGQLAALQGLLDEVGVMAANAPEDGDCFTVCEEIAMRVAAHGIPGGPEAAQDATALPGGGDDPGPALPAVWSSLVNVTPVGGMVCAVPDPGARGGVCGYPVESGPCPVHRDPDWRPE